MVRWRNAKSYARKPASTDAYETILIVCEGAKTEPNYFNSLKTGYGLTSVKVRKSPGTDPRSIADYAIGECDNSEWERVYCVFDQDTPNCQEAISRIQNSSAGRSGKLRAITSFPCFEIWVLLHFKYCNRPFSKSGKKSVCDNVVREVGNYIPDYSKGMEDVFDRLTDKLQDALSHAKRLVEHNAQTGSANPATQLHVLVDRLIALKKQKL
jgi:hypothetical protein